MKKNVFLLLFALCSTCCFAQDIIVKKDGSTIICKVEEVGENSVKYKKWSNKSGPKYEIKISDIFTINYKNGEKETFDNRSLSNIPEHSTLESGLQKKQPDSNNDEIMNLYNVIYAPTNKVKVKDKDSKYAVAFIGIKKKSIMSNEDIEMYFRGKDVLAGKTKMHKYEIIFKNKTDHVIYIDKANSFKVESDGETFPFYYGTQSSYSGNSGGSVTLGLGSVASVLGIGGAAGQLASGVGVAQGGGSSASISYSEERFLPIPPHGTRAITEERWIKSRTNIFSQAEYLPIEWLEHFNDDDMNLKRGMIKEGHTKFFEEEEFGWKREYYITYSNYEDFHTYSNLHAELYVYEIIGGAWASYIDDNIKKYVNNVNENTIYTDIYFPKGE